MANLYILDTNDKPVRCHDILFWAEWMNTDRQVADDSVETDLGPVRVSTIFMGVDYNFFSDDAPLLWETMVFGGALNRQQKRYMSKEEALEGHQRLLEVVRQSAKIE